MEFIILLFDWTHNWIVPEFIKQIPMERETLQESGFDNSFSESLALFGKSKQLNEHKVSDLYATHNSNNKQQLIGTHFCSYSYFTAFTLKNDRND